MSETIHNFLDNLLNEPTSDFKNHSGSKDRWVYQQQTRSIKRIYLNQYTKNEVTTSSIEKIFTLMSDELKRMPLTSLSPEADEKLMRIRTQITERVRKYSRRHCFIYRFLRCLFFGDINKISLNLIKQIHDFQTCCHKYRPYDPLNIVSERSVQRNLSTSSGKIESTAQPILTERTVAEQMLNTIGLSIYDVLAEKSSFSKDTIKLDKAMRHLPLVVSMHEHLAIRLPRQLVDKGMDKACAEWLKSLSINYKQQIISHAYKGKTFACEFIIEQFDVEKFLKIILKESKEYKEVNPLTILDLRSRKFFLRRNLMESIQFTLGYHDPAIRKQLDVYEDHNEDYVERSLKIALPIINFDTLGLTIKIPKDKPYLEKSILEIYKLSLSHGIDEIHGKYHYDKVIRVPRKEVPVFLKNLVPDGGDTLLEFFKSEGKYHEYSPIELPDPIDSITQSIAALVENKLFAEPLVILHPRGWMSIRIPKGHEEYKEKLIEYLNINPRPIDCEINGKSYDTEFCISSDIIPLFLKNTLQLFRKNDQESMIEQLVECCENKNFQPMIMLDSNKKIDFSATLAFTLATLHDELAKVVKENRLKLNKEHLPRISIESKGLEIFISKGLNNKKIKIGPKDWIPFSEYICRLFGYKRLRKCEDDSFIILVPYLRCQEFLGRDLQLYKLPENYQSKELVTFYNLFNQKYKEKFPKSVIGKRGTIQDLSLRNPYVPIPDLDKMVLINEQEMLKIAEVYLKKNHSYEALKGILIKLNNYGKFKGFVSSNIYRYTQLILNALKDPFKLSESQKKAVLLDIATGCSSDTCLPGILTKLQFIYQKIAVPDSKDECTTLLLSAIEECKNDILTELFSYHEQSVHMFSAAQVLWGKALGLNYEAGLLDHNRVLYGEANLNQATKKDVYKYTKYTSEGNQPLDLKQEFINSCRQEKFIENIHRMIVNKIDTDQKMADLSIYKDGVRKIYKNLGFTIEEIENEVKRLFPQELVSKEKMSKDEIHSILLEKNNDPTNLEKRMKLLFPDNKNTITKDELRANLRKKIHDFLESVLEDSFVAEKINKLFYNFKDVVTAKDVQEFRKLKNKKRVISSLINKFNHSLNEELDLFFPKKYLREMMSFEALEMLLIDIGFLYP